LNKAIRVGDLVIAVAEDGKPAVALRGKTVPEAVRLIRGPKGTTVRLTLVPAGKDESQARVVSLVRGELKELSKEGVALKELPVSRLSRIWNDAPFGLA
jgi:C-terminal processing protease CtpA/Prc